MNDSRFDSLQDSTRARYDDEMRYISAIVYRQMRAQGFVEDEQPTAWRPLDAIPHLPSEARVGHELSSLLEAAFIVELTYRSLWGERERVIDAFARMAAGIRDSYAASTAPAGNAYLRSASNIGGVIALNEEPRVDSGTIGTLLDAFDWERGLAWAANAEWMVEELQRRRPPTLTEKTYAARRAGPLSHLYWELARPMGTPEDHTLFAKQSWATEERLRPLPEPRLNDEQIAKLVDMTYAQSNRTEDDAEDAAERVRDRVRNFNRALGLQ